MIGIQGKDGVLSDEECLYLINYFNNSEERTFANTEWSQRFIEAKEMQDDYAKLIMKKAYSSIKNFVPDGFDADSFRIVVWNEGDSGELHSDNVYPWREFSSVIYLNHNFIGGHTEFPLQDVSVKPRTGLAIVFEGNDEYPHRVTNVVYGTRYTIASFWTKEKEHKFYEGWEND